MTEPGCTMLIAVSEPNSAGSLVVELDEDFDTVLEQRLIHEDPPITIAEQRKRWTHKMTNGKRIMVHPNSVGVLFEGSIPSYLFGNSA